MKKKNTTVVCADGFSLSVQANKGAYSEPRNDVGPYVSAEIGYPSSFCWYIQDYAEDKDDPTGTVYGWVPASVIRMCIDAHGGMVEGVLPNFDKAAWNGN